MRSSQSSPADRREFLRSCARWSVCGTLAGAVAVLAARGRIRPLSDACLDALPCGGCDGFGRCTLPAAVAARSQPGGSRL